MNVPEKFAVCLTVDEFPTPHVPSRRVACWLCRRELWVARSTPIDAVPTCVACAGELSRYDDDVRVLPPTEAQRDELRRYYGSRRKRE